MRIVQINFQLDAQRRCAEELLVAWWSVAEIAEAAACLGNAVSVIQACHTAQQFTRSGVDYYFVSPAGTPPAISASAEFAALLQSLHPDVIHVHGLNFPNDVCTVAKIVPGVPIFLQDHASRPPRPWHWPAWRRGLSAAAGVSFCALPQATAFRQTRLLPASTQVFEIPECTTRFRPRSRVTSRERFAMRGRPHLLWVGHLDSNKDPLTVLAGVSLAARERPELELWCCFGAAPLEREVERRITGDAALRGRVRLLGRVRHENIEHLMSAADAFVSASHREGSGYSLIEALACGLYPLVSDIPSFRALTGNGSVGRLWPCDDARALCEAILSLPQEPSEIDRSAVLAHFARELSFEALGRKFAAAYGALLHRDLSRSPIATQEA